MTVSNAIDLSESGMVSFTGTIFHGRTLSSSSSALTISNGDGIAANPTFALSANLQGLGTLSGTGYIVQTGVGTYATRTFQAGTGISFLNPDGVAGNTTITASATTPLVFHTDSGDATPAANAITIAGTSAQGVSTSGASSTVTLTVADASTSTKGVASFNTSNFTVSSGAVSSKALTITAGSGLSGGGSVNLGGSVALSLSSPVSVANGGTGDTSLTLNGVLYGNGTSAVGITAQGAANTVLLGNGGVPSFGAVPNAALQNSSITFTAGSGISLSPASPAVVSLGGSLTITATGGGFAWSDKSSTFTAAAANGYFCSATLTANLPASPANGDSIRIVSTGANVITIQAAGSQIIRLATVASSAGGTCASTQQGDAINLVYRSTDTTWYAVDSPTGGWNLA